MSKELSTRVLTRKDFMTDADKKAMRVAELLKEYRQGLSR